MTPRRLLLVGLLLAGLGLTLWSCTAQVEPGERGVVMRFGRVIGNVGPGLYFGLPWGLDRVQRVAADRVRSVTFGFTINDSDDLGLVTPPGQLLTGDHNLINVQVVLNYAVDEREVELFALYGDRADALVTRAAETVVAEWVAGRDVDEVLVRGKVVLPHVLKEETQKRLDPYRLGVRIQLANVTLNPPRQVKDAFEAVSRAQTEVLTRVREAQQEAETRWREAQAYKFNIEQLTTSYVSAKKNRARNDAKAFLARLEDVRKILKTNPDYLDAEWAVQMTKLLTAMQEGNRLRVLDPRLTGEIDFLEEAFPSKDK